MLIGCFDPGRLETSYARAFRQLSWSVSEVRLPELAAKYARFGRAGFRIQQFLSIEPWARKAGSEIVLLAHAARPDLIVIFGMADAMRAGAIAQIRATSSANIAWVWPDPLVNLSSNLISLLPLVDLVGTYSRATTAPFTSLGARKVVWLPLASDPELHGAENETVARACDVSFIGNWRQSREDALRHLAGIDLKIWGQGWEGAARSSPVIRQAWQRRPLVGSAFSRTVRGSAINLNLVDPTGYPAANMRVFELLVAGGLELCSSCPEFEDVLRHGEHLFYFRDQRDLPSQIAGILADRPNLEHVAIAGRKEVVARHTYVHRVGELLDALG